MAKRLKLNREQYKRVKRMDHKQMEDFICNTYNEGYADGKAAAAPRIRPSDIASVLIGIKGVGTKKAAEIMAAVNKLYERGATVRGIKDPFGDWCGKCGQKLDWE